MPSERDKVVETGRPADKEQQKILDWLRNAETSIPETQYRKTAKEDYQFYAGVQDTAEIRDKLESQNRPYPVFNEVKPKIDMLVGMAAQSPTTAEAIPVGTEDDALSELINGTLMHYQRKLGTTRKQNKCFEHVCKGGRSLLWFWINKSNPFKPQIKCRRWRSDQFILDPNATSLDLSTDGDHRFIFLEQWMTEEELKRYIPRGYDINVLKVSPKDAEGPTFWNEAKDLFRIMECWYYKYEEVFWFISPLTEQPEGLIEEDFNKFKAAVLEGIPLDESGNNIFAMTKDQFADWEETEVTKTWRKAPFYRLFVDTLVLEGGRSSHRWEGIPGVLFGGYKDDDNNCWFSATTQMKDQQRALNTTRRQLIQLLQTLPKGLLIHEIGAIIDIERYEQHSAEPNFHLEVNKGMIEKVKFEKQPSISPVYQVLDGIFHTSMKESSGVHDDLMGVETSSREATSTLRARQQTSYAVLYILFDNFRLSRFQSTRLTLSFIQQYVREPEVIRITGPKGQYLMQINSQMNPQSAGFNDVGAIEYDIAIDEIAETATMRTYVAEVLGEFGRNNPGSIPPDIILEYLNIPFTARQRITSYWEEARAAEKLQADREYELELLRIKGTVETKKAGTASKGKESK